MYVDVYIYKFGTLIFTIHVLLKTLTKLNNYISYCVFVKSF